MGNYERTYNAIHQYKMGKLFWQAKMKDLEGEYIRVVRAMCEWDWNNREGDLVLSLGGDEYKFIGEIATIQEIENYMEYEYEESKNHINKMISECQVNIRKCEGYLRKLEYIDGE